MQSEYLKPEQFCDRVPWSMSTVRRRLKRGDLPAIQPGGPGTGWLIDWTAFQCSDRNQSESTQAVNESEAQASKRDSAGRGPRPRWMRNLE